MTPKQRKEMEERARIEFATACKALKLSEDDLNLMHDDEYFPERVGFILVTLKLSMRKALAWAVQDIYLN